MKVAQGRHSGHQSPFCSSFGASVISVAATRSADPFFTIGYVRESRPLHCDTAHGPPPTFPLRALRGGVQLRLHPSTPSVLLNASTALSTGS